MKILVINTGSSSIKYSLFNMDKQIILLSGIIEKIGEKSGLLTHKKNISKGKSIKKEIKKIIPDHIQGMTMIVDLLMDKKYGAIRNKSELDAVGHRVVHGGEFFKQPIIIDEKIINAIKTNIPLAPLHNPPNLTGIETARSVFSDTTHVAVFDTAFHQTIPAKAFLYALPYNLYKKEKIRRYGFHGTSHAYVAENAAKFLKLPLKKLHMITIHLGNGASMAAIKKGECIDTTMGMTPLEGLVMGTRCGDIDPAIPVFMANHLKMSFNKIDMILNRESGLKGICKTNDMREVIEKKESGDPMAKIALDIYCYRIKKYIGAFFAALEQLDCVVFTGGIGENSPLVRKYCCLGLQRLGIEIDEKKNNEGNKKNFLISSMKSKVKILIIHTDEELKIAKETKKILEKPVVSNTTF